MLDLKKKKEREREREREKLFALQYLYRFDIENTYI